jgi:hypothetical protein
VLSLMNFPLLASHSALAVCRRCRWILTASSKPVLSSESKTGLRPCPGWLCRPDMPSDFETFYPMIDTDMAHVGY